MEDFEALLRRHYGPLERYVKFRMEGTGEGEDLLQEVCISALQKFPQLRDPERFKPWILQIARNKCRDYYRTRRPEQVPLETVEPWLTEPAGAGETVRDTLEALPERDRRLLELTYYVGLSQQEIARELQVPLGTVKSRMYAAKGRFRALYADAKRGDHMMKKLPEIMPEYTITPNTAAPFSVTWEEIMGWFIVPKEGETLKWAMYDFPAKKRTMYVDMEVQGKAKVHGIEGVKIRSVEHDPVPSEQIGDQKDVERFIVAQLTDTHCRLLAESHTNAQGTREYYTFLDGEDFLKNWGFGPDNCGNETHLSQKGLIHQNGNTVTVEESDWLLDISGRYTVTIGDRSFDTVCVWDIGCYDMGGASQQFLDKDGRTVLWRRFVPDDWALDHFGGKPWTERLPDNERISIENEVYVHWYDCITDYIL